MTKLYYEMINGRKYIYSKCEDCGVEIRYRSDSNKRKCNVCVYKYREYKVVEHYQPNKVKFCGGELFVELYEYPGYYVSPNGKVLGRKGSILKPCKTHDGYLRICIRNRENKAMSKNIHRLVAETFVPNPFLKPQVNHKNGIKEDNEMRNLEWVTQRENIIHSFDMGLHKPKRGDEHYKSKLTNDQVLEIYNELKEGTSSQKELAQKYKVGISTIGHIKTGRQWSSITGIGESKNG